MCLIDDAKKEYTPGDLKLYLSPASRTKASKAFKHNIDTVLVKQEASCEEMLSYEEFFGRRMAFRITGLVHAKDFTAVSTITLHF